MATTTDLRSEGMGTPGPGLFYLYAKVDFTEHPMAAASDDHKILAVQDGWIIVDSWYRMPTASTSTGTIDIGTAQNGTEIAAAVDADGALTAWTQGTPQYDGGAEVEITADGSIWLDCNTAAITDGVLEVLLLCVAAPGDDAAHAFA